jgi:FkbM family methyltransferase
VAIEPLRSSFERLRKNVELNRARNVRLVNAAALDRRSSFVLWAHPRNLGATLVEPPNPEFRREPAVDARPLTEILDDDEVANARVIKIDVEGSEGAVVAGMADLLSAARHDLELLVEIHPEHLRQAGTDPKAVVETLERAGFRGSVLPGSGTSAVVGDDGRIVTTEQVVFSRP